MLRTPQSQSAHNNMVTHVARSYAGWGKAVQAETSGYDRPPLISSLLKGQHRPDILTGAVIGEVETSESISHNHTAEQWGAFATYASEHRLRFVVVVPKGFRGAARARLAALDLVADVWEL